MWKITAATLSCPISQLRERLKLQTFSSQDASDESKFPSTVSHLLSRQQSGLQENFILIKM